MMPEQEATYRGNGQSECEAAAWEAIEGIGAGWRGLSTIIIGLARTVEALKAVIREQITLNREIEARLAALEAKMRRLEGDGR